MSEFFKCHSDLAVGARTLIMFQNSLECLLSIEPKVVHYVTIVEHSLTEFGD